MRQRLRTWFLATLRELEPARRMAPVIAQWRGHALAGGAFLVLAFGKAARGMAQALVAGLGAAHCRGLVVPPEPDDAPLPPFEVIAGGHPLPSAGSLRAAARALELARGAGPHEVVLFLVSGGGSAMLELPADPAVTLDELRAFYRALGASGADIVAMNLVRRHVSLVKGGRLLLAAAGAGRAQTVEISDVPDVPGALVASGPSRADDSSLAECRAVLDRFGLWSSVPGPLAARLRSGELPAPLRRSAADGAPDCVQVGTNHLARAALAERLRRAQVLVVEDQSVDDWHVDRAAERLLQRLDRLRRRHAGRTVAVLTGGELSVPLPRHPGTGGRNQQFVLACARRIRGRPITVLSAGTDGIDGNSPAAGGLADGTTLARARRRGLDVHDHLQRCDAFPLLDALGDTVVTGPSGTNVRDLRLLVHHG